MTACLKCGHDPDAKVIASWSFHIGREMTSGNRHVFNVGGSRWTYKKHRDEWQWEFRAVRLLQRIPAATTKRRVTLTRVYGARQRAYDVDNLTAGAKLVIDALVRETLLRNDSPTHAEIHCLQVRGPNIGTEVLIEELVDAA